MKITHQFIRLLLLCLTTLHFTAQAASAPANISHLGPALKITVQRGADKLPIYWVNHLQKGDTLIVTTDQAQKTDTKWLMVLATITPISNLVETSPFDLSGASQQATITITSDDQIPVVVLAPQVRTMFGMHTSFSESAALIADAIKTDPQRFIDLQKIDRINHAINYLLRVLDSMIQTKKNDQAIDAVKALAAKFGVRYLDPECFKDSTINTKCVAASIVSSAELTVPSDDMWSATGPNASAAKMPTDIFAGLKLITETSTYLVNKYGDNYDFAPSLGQRLGASDAIQLFTNARFKSGDVKTAYIYVPSWFENKIPEITIETKAPSCLTKNEISAGVKGNLPLLNYWHDWTLVIRAKGSDKPVAQFKNVDFKPDSGQFIITPDTGNDTPAIPLNGQIYNATLSGKFGFSDVVVNPFPLMMPASDSLLGQIDGLDNLISGEQVNLKLKSKNSNACIDQLNLLVGDTPIPPTGAATVVPATGITPVGLNVDLSKIEAGPATLEILQYGAPKQALPVPIFQRRAHLQKMTHYDLESVISVAGDNLDRIESIQLGKLICKDPASAEPVAPLTGQVKTFECPPDLSGMPNVPDKVTVKYKNAEPAAFDFPISKIPARPHMAADDSNATVVKLSATALQWNLNQQDAFISEDSGLGLLLHAFGGYKLTRGTYELQLRFSDDVQADAAHFTVPLMSDLAHNELRTKKPITFDPGLFPSVVNPVWYRVRHQNSGLTGDWQMLNRSILYLPQLSALSCSGTSTLIHGAQLELIDAVSADLTLTPAMAGSMQKAVMTQCGQDQCLQLDAPVSANRLKIKLHWIDNRLFDVTFPEAVSCGGNQ